MTFRAFIDGAARGNPGPAGAGVYVEASEGREAEEHFRALLLALECAEARTEAEVAILSDSLLLVEQMQGRFKVKAEHLKPLHAEALRRAKRFRRFSIAHVRREKNKDADRLANKGADASEQAAPRP
jgi:ribonuclease HI